MLPFPPVAASVQSGDQLHPHLSYEFDRVEFHRHGDDSYNDSQPEATHGLGPLSALAPPDPTPPSTDQPPVADAGGPYSGRAKEPVTLNAGASSDPDGNVVRQEWDFGDGTLGTGVSPNHTYDLPGTYTAQLRVWDELGASATTAATVTVGDPLSTEEVYWAGIAGASAAGSTLTKAGDAAAWDAGAVSARSIASGDCYVEFVASEQTTARMLGLSHGNADETDGDIDFAIQLTQADTVAIVEGGIERGTFGTYVPGDRFRISVDLGGVRYWKNGVVLYRSDLAPTYPLLVDASLHSPGATLRGVELAVSNGAPSVEIAGPDSCQWPCTLTFVAAATDPDGDAVSYGWSGCASGTNPTAECVIAAAGTYTATVTVTDGRGGEATAEAAATVYATAYERGPWGSCGGSAAFSCTGSGPGQCQRPGTQSRAVTGSAFSLDSVAAVTPPRATRSCTETTTGYIAGYSVGDWSPCSAPCGTGFTFRTVSPSAWSPVGPDAPGPIDNASCNQQACALTCWDYEMYDSRSDCQGAGWGVCEVRYRDDAVGGVLACWKGFD